MRAESITLLFGFVVCIVVAVILLIYVKNTTGKVFGVIFIIIGVICFASSFHYSTSGNN